MDWVKLYTHYDADMAIASADDAAEVMFTRGMAYCGRNRTGGFIPTSQLHHLTRHPGRAKRIVGQLTRPAPDGSLGPWEAVEGGYRIRNWEHYQDQLEAIEERRRSDRDRKRKQRSRAKTTSTPVTGQSRDSHADVRTGEEEEERETAAAAAEGAAAAAGLPPVIEILRGKLQAHTPLRGLRFDTLTSEQTAQLEALVQLHGDEPLVRAARDTCRNPAPTYVTAFLGTWAALPPPGKRLHVVQRLCDVHSTVLSPSGTCSACASEQKAADR